MCARGFFLFGGDHTGEIKPRFINLSVSSDLKRNDGLGHERLPLWWSFEVRDLEGIREVVSDSKGVSRKVFKNVLVRGES
jgi:hypothetical protein